ncbi:hypothetical protein EV715DRAFT_256517 [Schizophyllum commune]
MPTSPTKPASKTAANKPASKAGAVAHPTWVAMITECITSHPEEARTGVSRPTIKKFVESKYHIEVNATTASQLNRAITSGAEKGTFVLPKGPSGKVKLAPKNHVAEASKENATPVVKKPASTSKKPAGVKKPSATKKTSPPAKKASTAKANAAAKKSTATKKAAAAKKPTPLATKPKATNTTTTKSGRVAGTVTSPPLVKGKVTKTYGSGGRNKAALAKKPAADKEAAKKPAAEKKESTTKKAAATTKKPATTTKKAAVTKKPSENGKKASVAKKEAGAAKKAPAAKKVSLCFWVAPLVNVPRCRLCSDTTRQAPAEKKAAAKPKAKENAKLAAKPAAAKGTRTSKRAVKVSCLCLQDGVC